MSPEPVPLAEVRAKTLVLYVYASSDPEYEANLRHFLREGIRVRPFWHLHDHVLQHLLKSLLLRVISCNNL